MRALVQLGVTSDDGEVLEFYPQGEPFELAAHLQDFAATVHKQEEFKCGSTVNPEARFKCDDKCKFHLIIKFDGDGTVHVAYDNHDFADKVWKVLDHMIEDHEVLMHACGYHGDGSRCHGHT